MKVVASAREVKGKIEAPSSKSAVQRYIAGALFSEGITEIHVRSMCDDSMAALSVITALGAEVTACGDNIIIKGGFKPKTSKINCGESGLCTRMFIPLVSIYDGEITITGKGSILKRPIGMAEQPLRQLGVNITSENGFLPVKIKGPLSGGDVYADGSISSQFITGLLMALPLASSDSHVFVENLVSKPYIDLTINILNDFGIKIGNNGYSVFDVRGNQRYKAGKFVAEGDWSGASFLFVMGAIGGYVEVTGLDLQSVQADKSVLDALKLAGAEIKKSPNKISVTRNKLNSFEFDITECPDLAPPLAVLAMACNGRSVLHGAERLLVKESNRAETISRALSALGGKISYHDDIIEIFGGEKLKGGEVEAFNDHRIAMALVTASVLSETPVVIDGYECINKSYPEFTDDFRHLGGTIKIIK